MWELVRQIRDRGCTVVPTTHYMEEAERLCDRVTIVDRGRIVALDAPEALIGSVGADQRIAFDARGQDISSLGRLAVVTRVEKSDGHVIVYGHGDRFASSVIHALEDAEIAFTDFRTQEPDQEDVFLSLTGKEMRE